jgi:hypothetical protein
MSTEAVSLPASGLVGQLFEHEARGRVWSLVGWGVALGAHVLLASLALSVPDAAPAPPPPLDIELATPEPAPTPVPPPPAPADPRPVERAPTPIAKAAAPAPPEPAHVGALVTAKADPAPSPQADEPVDFTNDPSVLGFGSGVVALGGRAEVGRARAEVTARPAAGTTGTAMRPAGEALTPAADLGRKPSLNESDPCGGYFPAGASSDVAAASVLVTIAKSGAVSSVQLLSESPPKQGFGSAARTCMAGKHFSPGLDRGGNRVATAIRVNIRFAR